MDHVLLGLQGLELFVYMGDVVIYAKTIEEHNQKLNSFLKRVNKYNLTLEPSKCLFLLKEVTYLGHVITQGGVKPDPKKLKAVR